VNNLIAMFDLMDLSKIDDEDSFQILSFMRLSVEALKTSLNSSVDVNKQNEISCEKLEKVSFNEIFQTVQKSIGVLIEGARAEFQVDFSDLESILFSTAYMESIFLNLISNSIKYSRADVSPVISITTDQKNGEKTFVYSDNGLGFDMEKVGHLIFNLNQRFHANEDSKGVGLYLVYNHVTGLGGSISVASKVNEGTTFTIKFKA